MNIAINTLALYNTKVGMGRYIVELVNRLPAHDPQNIYYVYVSKTNKDYFTSSAENIIVKTTSSIWSFPLFKIIWEQFFLPFSLRKNNIQLYHGAGFTLPFLTSKKRKYIVTIADMTFFSHPKYHTWWKVFYFQHMIPLAFKKADTIITISENTKNDIIAKISLSPEKIKSIYLGVDEHFQPQKENTCKKFLEKYSITEPFLLFVGMLEPRKNVVGLLHAYALLKDKLKHHLVIAGNAAVLINPEDEREMKEAIEKLLNNKSELEKRQKAGILHAKKFSWDTMVKETKHLYEFVLSSSTFQ